jgi:tetratricopeptide (TPR) repeat protein
MKNIKHKKLMSFILLGAVVSATLSSCSRYNFRTKYESAEFDSLSGETLYRNNLDNFVELKSDNILGNVAQCYDKKINKGLMMLKGNFEANKDSPEYWNLVGNCYYLKAEFAKAKFYYELSFEISKKANRPFAYPLNNLAIIKLKFGDYSQAFALLKKSLAISAQLKTPRFNLGQLYLQFGQYEKAMGHLTFLYEINRKDIDVVNLIAITQFYQKNYAAALKNYEQIPEKFHTRADIALYYALTLNATGDYRKALKTISERGNTRVAEINIMADKLKDKLNKDLNYKKITSVD